MLGIGSAIGAGLGAVGSIFGGISASNAVKRVKNNIDEQKRKNQDWYDRRYNEDATQRADAQAILTRTEEALKNRNKRAAGAAAVAGASTESVAAEKDASNKVLADTMAGIAADAANRKDAIESQFISNDNALQNQLNDLELKKAQSTAAAIQGVTSSLGSAGILVDDALEEHKKAKG